MGINKMRSNRYITYKFISIIFILGFTLIIGIPALLSGIFTIPGIIMVIIGMYVLRAQRSFKARHHIDYLTFYKEVWKDKENRTIGEIIDAYKQKNLKKEKKN